MNGKQIFTCDPQAQGGGQSHQKKQNAQDNSGHDEVENESQPHPAVVKGFGAGWMNRAPDEPEATDAPQNFDGDNFSFQLFGVFSFNISNS